MERLHRIFMTITSTLGLILGIWLGFDLAGVLGAMAFAPAGAFLGGLFGAKPIEILSFFLS
jgi:hypothetical protein